jgi:prepilin-type N-terminal cleavage/methylation domain-containing protein
VRNSLIKKLTPNSTFSQVSFASSKSSAGFTLVELLIVIVIIGILAGVVIGVLNPVQQQNRARDANLRSQLDKMALATKGLWVSSPRNTNRAPTPAEFAAGIGSIGVHNCTGATPGAMATPCTFVINGVNMQSNCDATSTWTGDDAGSDTAACQFAYFTDGATFLRVAVHGSANPTTTFVYNYWEAANGTVNEGFYGCDNPATPAYQYNNITTAPSVAAPAGDALCTRL